LTSQVKACRLYGAKLVIAKIDRLSRDALFQLGLEKAGVDFVAADVPNANRLTAHIMAVIAQRLASSSDFISAPRRKTLRHFLGSHKKSVPEP